MEWKPPEKTLLKKEDLPSYHNVMCAIEEGNKIKHLFNRITYEIF